MSNEEKEKFRVEWTSINREQFLSICQTIDITSTVSCDGSIETFLNKKLLMFSKVIFEGEAYYCHPIVALFWGTFLKENKQDLVLC